MKRFILFAVLACILAGCSTAAPRITQIATIDSLLAGVYDGSETLGNLKRYGDLGIGTIDKLDGEMLMLDGTVYQVRADGKVYRPSDDRTTPFASVVDFKPEKFIDLPLNIKFKQLLDFMDKHASNPNAMTAIHIKGEFTWMRTRSVPAQQKPYRPLAEVTRTQPEFKFEKVSGDLVGFRLPAYVKGINVPGWHLHFITADRTHGGHVLDFELKTGSLELVEVYDFRMILPRDSAFAKSDLSLDRSQELHEAESAK